MTNEILLNKKIRQIGKTKRYLAGKCGMTYAGFYNCVKGKSRFNTDHVSVLCEELKITSLKEKEEIFFAKSASCNEAKKE